MYCAICGKENADGDNYCRYCGGALRGGAKAEETKQREPLHEAASQMQRGEKSSWITGYDEVMNLIVLVYVIIGGGIGYILSGHSGGYMIVGAAIGAIMGAVKVAVNKLLISIAKNLYIITNNTVVLESYLKEERKQ